MARPRTERLSVREAEIRTEEVREPVRKKERTRKGLGIDQMHIPQALIPDDIDLQWNTETVLGMPAQHETIAMAQQGWEPVTVGMFEGRFDYLMPRGHKGQIMYGASRLDWRPLELTMEARAEELQAARGARYAAERKIQNGTPDGVEQSFMDTNHPKAKANTFLRKEHGRVPSMAIPD